MRQVTLILASALMAAGCSYNESFPYQGDAKVNFTTDSLYFSFGELPFNITDTTLQIGVEIIGSIEPFGRTFHIALDSSRTTARLDEHYEMPETDGIIGSGKSSGHVALTVHRLSLRSDSAFVLTMNMIPSSDFGLGAVEYRTVSVCFTNRLDMPDWWSVLSQWIGEYSARKYQKFIELWGKAITRNDVNEKKYTILRTFHKVKDYFEAHPEFEVTFPEVDWPV